MDVIGMTLSTGTTPAQGDKRAQVLPLLATLYICTGKRGRPRQRGKVLAADPGEDAKDLRRRRRRGSTPQIPQREWKTRKLRGLPNERTAPHLPAERTFARIHCTYYPLVGCWDRRAAGITALLATAMMLIRIHRVIVG